VINVGSGLFEDKTTEVAHERGEDKWSRTGRAVFEGLHHGKSKEGRLLSSTVVVLRRSESRS